MPMLSAELWQEVRRKGQLPRWVTDFFKPGEKVNLKRGVTVSKSAQEEEEDNEEEMVDMEKEQEAMEKGKGKEYEASRFVYMGKEKRWKVTIITTIIHQISMLNILTTILHQISI